MKTQRFRKCIPTLEMLYYLEVEETITERFGLSGNKLDLASVTIQLLSTIAFSSLSFPKCNGRQESWQKEWMEQTRAQHRDL